jgi:hypothetical protein
VSAYGIVERRMRPAGPAYRRQGLDGERWPGMVTASCEGCAASERFEFGAAHVPAINEFRTKHYTCGPVVIRIPEGAEGEDLGLAGIREWRTPQSGKRGGRRR